jgi:hypothetical protein
MVLKTDGTKIYNDVNGNSDVRIYSDRSTNDSHTLSDLFVIPSTVGKLDCYKKVYERWRDWNEDQINARGYQMVVGNDSAYPKLINMIFRLEINTKIYMGDTLKIIAYPFILAPGAEVRLKNPWTQRETYWTGHAVVSVVAMPVTVPCAVSTPASSRATTDPANVSTIVSGTDKIQHLALSGTIDNYGLRNIGDSCKLPYITGSNVNNYQQNWWYTDYYYNSSSSVDLKRINNLTHTGYSWYQQLSSCGLHGDDSDSTEQAKTFKDGQIGLPFCIQAVYKFTYDTFRGLSWEATSVWNTLQWGKKYLKVTSQYFGYSISNDIPDNPYPSGSSGFYNCPSVTYDSNGNIISDNVNAATNPSGKSSFFNGVSFFFPLTDMNDGHLGSAYVVTEITE